MSAPTKCGTIPPAPCSWASDTFPTRACLKNNWTPITPDIYRPQTMCTLVSPAFTPAATFKIGVIVRQLRLLDQAAWLRSKQKDSSKQKGINRLTSKEFRACCGVHEKRLSNRICL